MTDLMGKTALVTGSVQGIGLAMAKAFASETACRIIDDPESNTPLVIPVWQTT